MTWDPHGDELVEGVAQFITGQEAKKGMKGSPYIFTMDHVTLLRNFQYNIMTFNSAELSIQISKVSFSENLWS